jgi:kynureninase
MQFENSLAFAKSLDNSDSLRSYRDQFHIPQHNGKNCIYLVGNSLGLQPKKTQQFINEELEDWKRLGVEGHFDASAKRPWFHYHKFLKEGLAAVVGAKPSEVVSMNSLTTNLHLMMVSFYRPTAKRFKIITEAGAFPSDQYALETQINFHAKHGGKKLFDEQNALVELSPRDGENTLRTEDILAAIKAHGNELALVMMAGVQYYTGQFFDLKSITKAAHDVGALAGFDLAHAVGNVPLNLHDDEVDFAAWCSYKYMNSGPGSVAGIFVHEKHGNDKTIPRFAGWWGQDESQRFQMKKGFIPMEGADGWQLSNVNVMSSAAHLASLSIFSEVGTEALRAKSLKLTGYLHYLLDELNKSTNRIQIITPKNSEERGCQISILVENGGKELFDALNIKGVISDWREPNVIRVAPVPLYNSFEDVFEFVRILEIELND